MKRLFAAVPVLLLLSGASVAQDSSLQPDTGGVVQDCRDSLQTEQGLGGGQLNPSDLSQPTVETCSTILTPPPQAAISPEGRLNTNPGVDSSTLTGSIGSLSR